ncbi:IMPACT family protein [Pedobacter sp. MR2016-24]|uniref:IMPACT family protein n=1 Tax=Pedobacter sp. MR2016-24 TaxID=2994466 RepID=UPI002247C7F5|nr:YigZ family protein [Pedobacter sp. MR2016-24]MCX2483585.1 YigZ family protein [Pedobacter sp. MR2016-24]
MLFDDTYKTIEAPAEGLFRDKGSKFMAFAYPLSDENEVKAHLVKLRAEHTKANHFCYAYRLSPDRNVFRVNDDGEPSGTAGRPILNTLLSADLTNVLVIVVRHFGGTLLGVPGLINAYKTATAEAIKQARIVSRSVNDIYEVSFEYLMMNDVMRLVKEEDLNIVEQQFDNNCVIKFEVRKSQLNKVLLRIEKQEGLKLKYLYTV